MYIVELVEIQDCWGKLV